MSVKTVLALDSNVHSTTGTDNVNRLGISKISARQKIKEFDWDWEKSGKTLEKFCNIKIKRYMYSKH